MRGLSEFAQLLEEMTQIIPLLFRQNRKNPLH
jgi:hypothetical protein